jgi:indole-3-glycerol phosphate synthase
MASRPNILDEIIAHKRTEVERLLPLSEKLEAAALARDDFRSFFGALGGALRDEADGIGYGSNPLSVIAEVKKGSPSAGIIAADFDPILIAQEYEAAGADAISVLTDEKYFQGHLSYLARIRETVGLPLLRKDFMIHEVQIH